MGAREQWRGLLVFLARYRKRFTFEVHERESRAQIEARKGRRKATDSMQILSPRVLLSRCYIKADRSFLPLSNKFQSIDLENIPLFLSLL